MHKKTKDRLTDLFITLILFAVALLIIVPMVWITICAFRPQKELMQYPPQFFTSNFTLQNFTEIARRIKIWGYVKNSVVYCLASTIPSVFLNSLAGYAFARLSFKGKKIRLSV